MRAVRASSALHLGIDGLHQRLDMSGFAEIWSIHVWSTPEIRKATEGICPPWLLITSQTQVTVTVSQGTINLLARHDDRGAIDRVLLDRQQRFIRLAERELGHPWGGD